MLDFSWTKMVLFIFRSEQCIAGGHGGLVWSGQLPALADPGKYLLSKYLKLLIYARYD